MTSGLARRIAVTLGALLVFRLGSYFPIPGIIPPREPAAERLGSVLSRVTLIGAI